MNAHDAALRPLQLHDVEITAQRREPIRRAAPADVLDLARAAAVVFNGVAEMQLNRAFQNAGRSTHRRRVEDRESSAILYT